MKPHPAAALFPDLGDDDMLALVNDIKVNGLRQPIITWNGMVLDGRNRLRACSLAGVKPRFEDQSGLSETGAIGFIISHNLRRRHMTESQRAMVAAELANLKNGGDRRPKQSATLHSDPPAITSEAAAEMLNVSRRSVQKARTVKERAPDLAKDVKEGKISVNAAEHELRIREKKPVPARKGSIIRKSPLAAIKGAFLRLDDDERMEFADWVDEQTAKKRAAR